MITQLTSTIAIAAETTPNSKIPFNIPRQRADLALVKFAEQADVTYIFPFDAARQKTANQLVGNYAREEAIKILLQGTGLQPEFRKDGAMTVQLENNKPEPEGGEMPDSSKKKRGIIAGLIAALSVSGGAYAQSEPREQKSKILEELIVTAQRREQDIRNVPISINTFSASDLEQSGIIDIRDLQHLAAGLQITSTQGQIRVTMRGIGTNEISPWAESGVAVHRDGIYLAQQFEQALGFFDLERVEVLRGPQGTLYGRNATGGAINLITKAPTEHFEAGASVTVGNYSLVETKGYASGPLADNLTARVAFKTRDNDGYTPNVFTSGERHDNDDMAAGRVKFHYEPTENINFDLIADYARDTGIPGLVVSRYDPATPLPGETISGVTLPASRALDNDGPNSNEREAWGITAKLEWFVHDLTLTSLTAYRNVYWNQAQDIDKTRAAIGNTLEQNIDSEQFSQELILASPEDRKLQWLVGASYFDLDQKSGLVAELITLSTDLILDLPKIKNRAYAVFGDASYSLTDRLTLNVGARYSYEKKSRVTNTTLFGATASVAPDGSWNSFTPKGSLIYEVADNISTYATISKGFKAGGFGGDTAQTLAFRPEEVTNYEIGMKSLFFDNRVSTNLSAFYMDYSDLQVQAVRIGTGGLGIFVTDNAATSEIKGVEFEVNTQLTDRFSIDGNVSYLDAKFDEWSDAVDPLQGNAIVDASGNTMLNAPEWALNIDTSYTIPFSSWTATLYGSYSYKGDVFFTAFENPTLSQKGYSLLNSRITIEWPDKKWHASLFVNNITDKEVATDKFALLSGLFGDRLYSALTPPRTFGLIVGYDF